MVVPSERGRRRVRAAKKPLSYTPMNLHNRYEHREPANPTPG